MVVSQGSALAAKGPVRQGRPAGKDAGGEEVAAPPAVALRTSGRLAARAGGN